MRRVGLLAVALVVMVGLVACQSNVHHAKILDVRLEVRVMDFGLASHQPHKVPHRPMTYLDLGLSISNPSDQHVWANGCRGQAVGREGSALYTFSVAVAPPAGVDLGAHKSWSGPVLGVALVPRKRAARGVRASVTCQAWDWDGYPPI